MAGQPTVLLTQSYIGPGPPTLCEEREEWSFLNIAHFVFSTEWQLGQSVNKIIFGFQEQSGNKTTFYTAATLGPRISGEIFKSIKFLPDTTGERRQGTLG